MTLQSGLIEQRSVYRLDYRQDNSKINYRPTSIALGLSATIIRSVGAATDTGKGHNFSTRDHDLRCIVLQLPVLLCCLFNIGTSKGRTRENSEQVCMSMYIPGVILRSRRHHRLSPHEGSVLSVLYTV